MAFLEVDNTELGQMILEKLFDLKIINMVSEQEIKQLVIERLKTLPERCRYVNYSQRRF